MFVEKLKTIKNDQQTIKAYLCESNRNPMTFLVTGFSRHAMSHPCVLYMTGQVPWLWFKVRLVLLGLFFSRFCSVKTLRDIAVCYSYMKVVYKFFQTFLVEEPQHTLKDKKIFFLQCKTLNTLLFINIWFKLDPEHINQHPPPCELINQNWI